MSPKKRHHVLLLALAAALVAALAGAVPASADWFSPESGGSQQANDIDTLYWITMAIAVVIFLAVDGALLYALFKFRARKGQVAAQIRGNTRLEIGWTVGAGVILVVLAVVTFVMLDDIRNPPNSDADGLELAQETIRVADRDVPMPPNGNALNIDVNGQQYVWRYTYPDGDDNPLNNVFQYEEMVVPTGTTVVLSIRAQDVAHSWWIPKLGGKRDAVPGYTNYDWFKISEPGIYRGQCAELCGRGHANMIGSVRAVPPAEYEQWFARKQAEIQQANQAAQRQRQQVEAGGQPGS